MFFLIPTRGHFLGVKGIYDLIPDYGVTAQLRYRQYHDSNINVTNNYFNPKTITYEGMFALGIRKKN